MSLKEQQPLVLQAEIEILKNGLRLEHGIESLIRHIVFAERRLFAILVCESPVQAKAAANVLEKAVAEMEGGGAIPFLRFAYENKASDSSLGGEPYPATFQELVSQILEPLFYWNEEDKEKKVVVIDASGAKKQDEEAWIILFQRMNEVRNTLMNHLPGPLLLILTPGLAKEFPGRAPDFWSVRSAFVQAEANLKALEPLEMYKKRMKDHYGKLQIWKTDTPVSLEGIYTRVKVLSTPIAFRQATFEELRNEFHGKLCSSERSVKEIDGLEAVRENRRLFILGKPGAGKTTFLKYTTLQAIDNELNYVPIFIPLRSFSESRLPLLDFIVREFERFDFPNAHSFIMAILKEGKTILLCDGLDEVKKQDGLRDRVVDELYDFSGHYKECKIVVTCRVAIPEYRQFKDFVYVEMADFDNKQIRAFAYKWFAGESQIGDKFLKGFEGSRSRQIQDLAKNPLLLTLLCISFHETLSFPSRRSEIYEEALNALLKKWNTFKRIQYDDVYKNLSLGRKRQMFARIAYDAFEKGEYLFEENRLAERVSEYMEHLPFADAGVTIDGNAVVKAIEAQHGIFIERAQGIYSFAHLTFQEHYTAKYIVANARKVSLIGLIENHFLDETWREVFLLTAEMMDDAGEFFEIFLKALDDFVGKDERLVRLLCKAEKDAENIDDEKYEKITGEKSFRKRSLIINLILDIAFALSRSPARISALEYANFKANPSTIALSNYNHVDNNLYLARYKNIAKVSALNSAILYAIKIDPTLELDGIHILDIARNLVPDLALDLVLSQIRTGIITSGNFPTFQYYNMALIISKDKKHKELHKTIARLSFPEKTNTREMLKFTDSLLDIMCKFRPIEDYEFTLKQVEHVEQYLKSTKLLLDCLELAYVKDRTAIEDRLLRPPNAAGATLRS